MTAAAEKITPDFEILFVNDGSPDHALQVAQSLFAGDRRVKIIDLSRNFGHHKAMMTGLAHASGEWVFKIDCDLEESPEALQQFWEERQRTGVDVVYGVQRARKGRLFERLSGGLFWRVFNLLSDQPVPANLVTACLMSRRYVAALVQHQDREIFLAGLSALTGFAQTPLVIDKLDKGSSTYGLRRKAAMLVNAITSFSSKPLIFIFYLGCLILLISGSAGVYLVVRRLFFGGYLEGWPSLIVSVWFLGGLTIFCLGVIGIYLSKVFMETKRRPFTIVRDVYEHTKPANGYRPAGQINGEAQVIARTPITDKAEAP